MDYDHLKINSIWKPDPEIAVSDKKYVKQW